MNCATNIAIIENGIVQNVVWGYVYDTSFLSDNQCLAAVDDLSVNIGDEYINGKFYHNGKEVKSIFQINEENEAIIAELVEIIYGSELNV